MYKNTATYTNATQLEYRIVYENPTKYTRCTRGTRCMRYTRCTRCTRMIQDVQDVWGSTRQIEGIQVSTVFTMEPEAGKWPEICLLNAGSVGAPAFGGLNHLQFDPIGNWTALYLDQSLFWYLRPTIALQCKSVSGHPSQSPTAHNGSTYLSYGCSWRMQQVDVNNAQSVINNTTDLSEGLPVINDTTDLSERLPVIDNTSIMMTPVKGYQLSTIWQRRPEWMVASYWRYYTITTWVKNCQSLMIWVQK